MFVINSDSNSKLTKIVSIIFALSAAIGLVYQIMSLLALTKTKIGKKIRGSIIGTMYDYVDESIDEAAVRMPKWMEKIEYISKSIDQ